MPALDVLREHEDGRLRTQAADLGGSPHALVLVGRRHANVDDREVGLVLGDDREQRLGVAHATDDLVHVVLEQAGEAFAEYSLSDLPMRPTSSPGTPSRRSTSSTKARG